MLAPVRVQLNVIGTGQLRAYREAQKVAAWMPFHDFEIARGISAPGHISVDEARFLGELVRRTDARSPIIEIGTLFGFSTLVLAMNKHVDQPLLTIDNYSWNPFGLSPQAHWFATADVLRESVAAHAVQQINTDKAIFYRTYSGPPPGLFFCDADHSYEATLADLKWARSVGSTIICGHDYHEQGHPGVVRAVKEMGGPSELRGMLFVL